jgi:hypothetical protein
MKLTVITPLLKLGKDFEDTAISMLSFSNMVDMEWIIVAPEKEVVNICSNEHLVKIENFRVIKEKNASLWGAYNTAIKEVSTDFYIPLSAGDMLLCTSIDCILNNLKKMENIEKELIFFSVLKNGQLNKARDSIKSLIRTSGFSSGHSSSCMISVRAHEKYGYYDESYALAADNYFFELIYRNSKSNILWLENCVLGFFKGGGISVENMSLTNYELYKSRTHSGRLKIIESLIFLIRTVKYKFINPMKKHKKKSQ